ncbi:alpha/beta hydrolase [Streptomyces sp. NRRL F-5123]|uniref:alpha/beta hydrolase n=1 Tax=Streptomyces sp. NRRL F-5123 TaxID=1463856 RepID=UPI0004E109C0|nr:alpha/beta hydrolase [Streptomyces sp. NRRL F-5123]
MNDIAELKQYVGVHAKAQGIPHYRQLLDRIRDDGEGPGSWVAEWSAAARELESQGKLLEACRHYNMARFPFVDGEARRQAMEGCVRAFDRWRRENSDIQRLEVDMPGGRVACWTSNLVPGERRPLLLIMGGIISVKEQWAPMLMRARSLGMAGLVTEMPGVGENTLRYGADSWLMISRILDAVRDLGADATRVHAMALSFSGHLALRCAVDDPRIRGVVVAGAPVGPFFTDPQWQQALPRVTVDTMAHLMDEKPGDVPDRVRDWALTGSQLRALQIPVHGLVSLRDEIIPAGDVRMLRENVRRLHLHTYDDVHGSPRHVAESGLRLVLAVLRTTGASLRRRASLRWRIARLRSGR